MAEKKKNYQLFTIHPKCFQAETVELDHWLEDRPENVDLKAINLLIIQSVRVNKPKGDGFREGRAKRQYLQERINVGRKRGTAHGKQGEPQSMHGATETGGRDFNVPVMSDPPDSRSST